MSEGSGSTRLEKTDRWSWVVATAGTIGLFSVCLVVTGDVQFSAVVGAGAGIGIQYLLPYLVSLTVSEANRTALDDHPTAGNNLHGAVGGGLIAGALLAFAVMGITMDSLSSLLVGVGTTVGVALVLKTVLPHY
ncbi:hypothetical protein ACLI4R_00730 [Natrialbaceae archaeon A-chndr2]